MSSELSGLLLEPNIEWTPYMSFAQTTCGENNMSSLLEPLTSNVVLMPISLFQFSSTTHCLIDYNTIYQVCHMNMPTHTRYTFTIFSVVVVFLILFCKSKGKLAPLFLFLLFDCWNNIWGRKKSNLCVQIFFSFCV